MEIKLNLEDIIKLHDEVIKISGGDNGTQNTSALKFALEHIKNIIIAKKNFFIIWLSYSEI